MAWKMILFDSIAFQVFNDPYEHYMCNLAEIMLSGVEKEAACESSIWHSMKQAIYQAITSPTATVQYTTGNDESAFTWF